MPLTGTRSARPAMPRADRSSFKARVFVSSISNLSVVIALTFVETAISKILAKTSATMVISRTETAAAHHAKSK